MWRHTPLSLGSKIYANKIKNANSLWSAVNKHPSQVPHPTSGSYCNLCCAMSINKIKNANSLWSAVNKHPSQVPHPTSGSYCNLCCAMSIEAVKVVVEPTSTLHDEAVSLTVDGLKPKQNITLEASMTDSRGVPFFSYSHYKANDNGHVDVNTMESLGGSYKGLFPMGPIATLSPMLQKHKYTRFFKKDVENPNVEDTSGAQLQVSADSSSSMITSKHPDPT
ncbi:uncharacterized protein LOC127001642 isoform X21 [Eriocheir sinensis]|uniref:uncharacterized protein LOC127001642 isoform X21 n=1 Tax=Eriocheir sinensis TaxID=95602 RepID=UPI0021CAE1BE|nr:uncharacterized protein LOC127001642 isoform X21 [Eriocheir sinensis]